MCISPHTYGPLAPLRSTIHFSVSTGLYNLHRASFLPRFKGGKWFLFFCHMVWLFRSVLMLTELNMACHWGKICREERGEWYTSLTMVYTARKCLLLNNAVYPILDGTIHLPFSTAANCEACNMYNGFPQSNADRQLKIMHYMLFREGNVKAEEERCL